VHQGSTPANTRRITSIAMPRRTQRDHDQSQELDPAGERGGDTGPLSCEGGGLRAEKGDLRRDKPVHSGPNRWNAKQHSRSGSDSNASR
jgi:hypothetical protein